MRARHLARFASRSHASSARRRQSRCRELIATVFSGCKFCLVDPGEYCFFQFGQTFPRRAGDAQAHQGFSSHCASGRSLLFRSTISFPFSVCFSKCGGFGAFRSTMCSRKSACLQRTFGPRNSFALQTDCRCRKTRQYRASRTGIPRRLIDLLDSIAGRAMECR